MQMLLLLLLLLINRCRIAGTLLAEHQQGPVDVLVLFAGPRSQRGRGRTIQSTYRETWSIEKTQKWREH